MLHAQARGTARDLGVLFSNGTVNGLTDAELLERFTAHRDEDAFAALVARHGPVVLSFCRDVLRPDEAEDAFQATFLILAVKAKSLRRGEALGVWIHRVARRVACQLSIGTARRTARERRAAVREIRGPEGQPFRDESIAILHEEIDRLPEKYRAPIVLCELGELSREEAARQLGWPSGTVSGRLARGRNLLRDRLTRRGLGTAGGILGATGATREGLAAIPQTSLIRASEAASRALARPATDPASTAMAAHRLAAEVLRAMIDSKVRSAVRVFVLSGIVLAAVVAAGAVIQDRPERGDRRLALATNPAPRFESPKAEPPATLDVRGRVFGPDGGPVAGAKLTVGYSSQEGWRTQEQGVAGPDGAFRFTLDRAKFGGSNPGSPWSYVSVAATFDGLGLGWAPIEPAAEGRELTLKLVEDVPVEGRILDPDGRPVAGAEITVDRIQAFAGDDVGAYAAAIREARNAGQPVAQWYECIPGKSEPLITGADGRFRLTGAGRERVVQLRFKGPKIQHWMLSVMTRDPAKLGGALPLEFAEWKVYGASFEHRTEPIRPVRGIVREKESGRPVADVTVSAAPRMFVSATTDRDGKFTLPGCLKAPGSRLYISPGVGQPFFAASADVPAAASDQPAEVAVDLYRGIALNGQVTDGETGRPIMASVEYLPLATNQAVGRLEPNFTLPCSRANTKEDGTFTLPILPGPGVPTVLSMGSAWRERYLPAAIDAEALKAIFGDEKHSDGPYLLRVATGGGKWAINHTDMVNALVWLNPGEDVKSLTRNAVLRVGRSLGGTVLDADGQPLSGVSAYGLSSFQLMEQRLETAEFEVKALDIFQPRTVVFQHAPKGLGAVIQIAGDHDKPLKVRLERCGSATGRLLDQKGKPAAGVKLHFRKLMPGHAVATTERDGRFRVEGLIPGLDYSAVTDRVPQFVPTYPTFTVQPGESKSLGEAQTDAQ